MRHFISGMLLLTLGVLAVPQVTHAQLPEKPENLQVLPEDITGARVGQVDARICWGVGRPLHLLPRGR